MADAPGGARNRRADLKSVEIKVDLNGKLKNVAEERIPELEGGSEDIAQNAARTGKEGRYEQLGSMEQAHPTGSDQRPEGAGPRPGPQQLDPH